MIQGTGRNGVLPETPGGGGQALPVWGPWVTDRQPSTAVGSLQEWSQPPFSRPACPPLPWSRLSPPGSPASSMAHRLHPCRYWCCRRGHGRRLALRVPVPEPSQGAQRARCPCLINIKGTAGEAAGTAPPAGAPPALTLPSPLGEAGKRVGAQRRREYGVWGGGALLQVPRGAPAATPPSCPPASCTTPHPGECPPSGSLPSGPMSWIQDKPPHPGRGSQEAPARPDCGDHPLAALVRGLCPGRHDGVPQHPPPPTVLL